MTDAELTQAMAELQEVVRCRCDEAYRDRGLHDPQCECDSAEAVKIVANRIKALTKERDDYAHKLMRANNTYTEMHLEIERLSDKLATCEKYRDAYAECDRIGTQAVRDLEAKLAKARVALSEIQRCVPKHIAGEIARVTLAEIKGESHD